MYNVYLGNMLCPIAPEKIQLKVANQNKTMVLMNGEEINIIRSAGLSEISFSLLLPNSQYPFAVYNSGFKYAAYFLNYFEKLKTEKKPFQFIVSRYMPNGNGLFSTNMTVSMESYTIAEDAKDGFDLRVKIKLKQYREFETKSVNIKNSASGTAATVQNNRANSTVQSPVPIMIGSEVIVNGRIHGSSYGDAPGKTLSNSRGKVNFINLKGSHPYHVTTLSGGWLGWVHKDSVQGV